MAKLIVTRPRSRGFRVAPWSIRILVDGTRVASVGAGMTAEIPLPPGRHQVTAHAHPFWSRAIEIDAGDEDTHHLAVDYDPRVARWFWLSATLPFLIIFGLFFWDVSHGGARALADRRELWIFAFATSGLPLMLVVHFLTDQYLALDRVPNLDWINPHYAALLKSRPLRWRISIRRLMFAVAVAGIVLGTAVTSSRYQRRRDFRKRADLHARSEALYRETEQGQERTAAELNKRALDGSFMRQSAARSAARADYHAALKRKYEQAADGRWRSVEPDPPEPPWP
jgi:hypothetical protein